MKEYLKQSSAVLDEVASSLDGLSSAESAARLEKNGKNKLAEGKKESLIKRFFKQLAEPMTIILLVAAAISVVLLTFGDLAWEIAKAVWYVLKLAARAWGGHMPLYLVEGVIALITVFTVETLLFYACICIGQQYKKNRTLAAVGAYFGFYVVKQIFGTIALLIGSQIDWYPLTRWIDKHPFATAHIGLCGGILVEVAIGCFLYWLSHRLITHRLNLE
jgi:magnesium-transporting ATPase (P-type)